ncbi:thylakoid assembly 8-like protein, chloroplastic [Tanacetum coccineum]
MGTNPTIRLWHESKYSYLSENVRIWVYLAEFRCPTEVSSGSPSFILLPLNHSLFAMGLQDIHITEIVGLSIGEKHFIQGGIAQDIRTDGRKRLTYHPLVGETGVIAQTMTRVIDDDEKLDKFVKTHVSRLLKMDMVAVLNKLERQEEVQLAVKVYPFPLYSIILIT